jgi:general secretion pathway protein I
LRRSIAHHSNARIAGFTLIEALVALAVVAMSLTAIGALFASTTRGTRRIENHVELVQNAYSVLALDQPSRASISQPVLEGARGGHRWRVELAPLTDVVGNANDGKWLPQKVRLTVESGNGSSLQLETIRLFKKATK